jgi:hypothetical protein
MDTRGFYRYRCTSDRRRQCRAHLAYAVGVTLLSILAVADGVDAFLLHGYSSRSRRSLPLQQLNRLHPIETSIELIKSRPSAGNLQSRTTVRVSANGDSSSPTNVVTTPDANASLSPDSSLSSYYYEQVVEFAQPVQQVLDDVTGGWALYVAPLQGTTRCTGQAFLATNLAYGAAGLFLLWKGDVWLGTMTDVAALASYCYHYYQLELSTIHDNESLVATKTNVRLALLVDYIVAFITIGVGLGYLLSIPYSYFFSPDVAAEAHVEQLQQVIAISVASVSCLALGWKFEYGAPYLTFHSLWHILSAYVAFMIGGIHQDYVLYSTPEMVATIGAVFSSVLV